MAIRSPHKSPSNAHDLLADHFELLGRTAMSPLGRAAIQASDAIDAHFVGLDALARGELVHAAHHFAWRYLVTDGASIVAEADIVKDDKGHFGVVAVHHGARGNGMIKGLGVAATEDRLVREHHDARSIEARGVHFVALWLHGDHGDLFVPIEPDRTPLKKYHAYTEQEVLAVLQGLAQSVLDAQSKNPGPSGG